MKPTLLESCKEDIVVEKDLHEIGVIKDDESMKYSKDASRNPQAMARKGRDKETTNIETLTHLVKNLTTEISKLKQWKKETFTSSHPPRQRQASSSSTNSSSNNQFGSKFVQNIVFQLNHCVDPSYCSFHEEYHPKNSCSDWNKVVTSVCINTLDVDGKIQEQLEDTDDNEEVAPNEAPCSGHVVNAYQFSQEILKINTEKQPQKQNYHYHLRSKGAPHTLEEMQE